MLCKTIPSPVFEHTMDKPTPPAQRLLDDLESIHHLLEEPNTPPLLTDIVTSQNIPVLSERVDMPEAAAPLTEAARHLTMTQLAPELRQCAELLLQEVVDEFIPLIEMQLRRRLEERLDRLVPKR